MATQSNLFSRGKLLESLGNDEEILKEFYSDFLDSYPRHLTAIQAAIEAKKCDVIAKSAHAFKGIVASFQAEPVKQAISKVEDAGKSGQLTNVRQDYMEMEFMVNTLAKAFKSEL